MQKKSTCAYLELLSQVLCARNSHVRLFVRMMGIEPCTVSHIKYRPQVHSCCDSFDTYMHGKGRYLYTRVGHSNFRQVATSDIRCTGIGTLMLHSRETAVMT